MTLQRPNCLYGARRLGFEALAHCRAHGVEPRAFIDRAARPGATLDGVRVLTPELTAGEASNADVLVALHAHNGFDRVLHGIAPT